MEVADRPPVPFYDRRRDRRCGRSEKSQRRWRQILRMFWDRTGTIYAVDGRDRELLFADIAGDGESDAPESEGHQIGDGAAVVRTYQQIADELGCSRERVRQIEARALVKIFNNATLGALFLKGLLRHRTPPIAHLEAALLAEYR